MTEPHVIAVPSGNSPRPRVVVTGLGVVSPIGVGRDAFWSHLQSGETGIRTCERLQGVLPSSLAAEISGFNPLDYVAEKRLLKVMSRDIQFAVAASKMAMDDAGLRPGDVDPHRLGVEFGAGHQGFRPEDLAAAAEQYASGQTPWAEGPMGQIAPLWLLPQLPNMPACHVAIDHGAEGPNNTITSGDASALLALDEAVRVIERGQADAMIVGATSSRLDPLELARLNLFDSLSRRENPDEAPRPFDRDRDGAIVGEGSAVFVIERFEHAVARGADIYGEILGVGAGCDGREVERAAGLTNAISSVLRRSGLRPHELGHINAHGKGTIADDRQESVAYHRAMGDSASSIPVTALKSYFGHFDAGSGAVELAGSLLALRHGVVPMSLHYRNPDPNCDLSIVDDGPVRLRTRSVLSVNRTPMGQSAAAIVRAL